MYNRAKSCIILIILFSLSLPLNSAQGEELFSRKCEGKYFTIYYQPEIDLLAMTREIDIYPSQYLIFDSQNRESNPELNLTKTLDALFLEVSDILDMHLYSFHGNIKVCRDFEELEKIFYDYYNLQLKTPSFYIYNSNTIYVDAASLNACVLGHEIAHAIICHYFVVLPPIKVQEVLAGYVEYQLKKR